MICNHCGVMAALSRKMLKICDNFLRYFGKRFLMVIFFQNHVPNVFTASPIDVVVLKFREIWPMGNRQNHALFTGQKFRLPLKLSLLRGSRPKSDVASPINVPRVLQISSKSVHFRRSYSRTREHRQIAPLSESNIYLFIITPDGSQTYSYTNTTQLYKNLKNMKQHRNNGLRSQVHRHGKRIPNQFSN